MAQDPLEADSDIDYLNKLYAGLCGKQSINNTAVRTTLELLHDDCFKFDNKARKLFWDEIPEYELRGATTSPGPPHNAGAIDKMRMRFSRDLHDISRLLIHALEQEDRNHVLKTLFYVTMLQRVQNNERKFLSQPLLRKMQGTPLLSDADLEKLKTLKKQRELLSRPGQPNRSGSARGRSDSFRSRSRGRGGFRKNNNFMKSGAPRSSSSTSTSSNSRGRGRGGGWRGKGRGRGKGGT